jgi:uncharacterized membrane protein
MPEPLLVLVLVTSLGAALAAGVFFAFSNFVMAALGRIPAAEGIRAMQTINVTVINPLFMAVLFGTGLLCLAVIVAALADWDDDYSPFLVGAGVAYLVGTVLVTMAFNVPRNNEVARQDPNTAAAEEVWGRYLREWTAWNTVRTIASAATMIALVGGIAAG